MILFWYFGAFIFLLENQSINGLNCRDTKGFRVQWYLAIKPPSSNGYAYKLSTDTNPNYHNSERDITSDSNSILIRTFAQIYQKHSKYNYVMYNNIIPEGYTPISLSPRVKKDPSTFKHGESKGVLVWHKETNTKSNEKKKAMWFIHSVPGFMMPFTVGSFSYPGQFARTYGQIFLCVTVPYSDVENILVKLLLAKVRVYYKVLPDDVLKRVQDKVYDKTLNVRTINTSKALQESTSFVNIANGDKLAVIVKTSKDSQNAWMKTFNTLRFTRVFYMKTYPFTVNQDATSTNEIKIISKLKIGDIKWGASQDASHFGFADPGNYFCINDSNPGVLGKTTSIVACLYNENLKAAMKSMVDETIQVPK